MGIQTFVKKIKTKRGMKKAEESGEALTNAGVTPSTPKDTQGKYVTSSATVTVSPGGKVTSTPTSGNKVNNKITPYQPQSTLSTPTEGAASSTPIEVTRSGSVKVGNKEYTGNAKIPELNNQTANQVQNETRRELVERERQALIQEGKEYAAQNVRVGPGRYSAKGEITSTSPSQTVSPVSSEGYAWSAINSSSLQFPALDFAASENLPSSDTLLFDVQPVKQQTGIRGFFQDVETRRGSLETSRARGTKIGVAGSASLIGLSALTVIKKDTVGIFNLGKGLVTKPISTVKNIPSGFVLTAKEYGTILKTGSPEQIVGTGIGEYIFFKGTSYTPKAITQASDVIRTRNMVEVPSKEVIAPEYFAGQQYPQIKKGQTAGQLLKEFQSQDRLTGLTASPNNFDKATTAGAGSSELPGIYQAPKLSPNFLRISGEGDKAFSFNPFETLKPTVIDIKPTAYELIEGTSYSQKKLTPVSVAKDFFKNKAETGKSYVPFLKTEKEAVIPAGTPLSRTAAQYYFKFEGRRVPIYEYAVDVKGVKSSGIRTAEDVFKSSSYRRLGSKGKITPVELYSVASKSYSYVSPKVNYKYSVTNMRSNSYLFRKISSSYSKGSRTYTSTSLSSVVSSTTSKSKSYSSLSKSGVYGLSSINTVFNIGKYPSSSKTKQYTAGSKQSSLIPVFGRRFGKFKIIGFGKNEAQALSIGKDFAKKTLGATFKVPGAKTSEIPGYKTKYSAKEGKLFIQLPRYRLSSGSEKAEINKFRMMKVAQ